MPDTIHLENKIDEADLEMKAIADAAAELQAEIDEKVRAFAHKYPQVEMSGLSEDFASRLSDIVDDLQGPAWRRKSRLEDEICNLEWDDLNRSRPVVL
jgi:hypothetical protein